VLLSAAAVLFFIAYFGAFLPAVKSWQPLRFKVPLDLFLVIGAAYAVFDGLPTRATSRSRSVPMILTAGLAAFFINLVQTETAGKLQLRAQLNSQISAVFDWIERATPG